MDNLSASIELTNAKFVDVINGCFFDQGTSVLIKNGKIADLAILNGNPFEDSSLIGRCLDALFMDGRLIINNCGLETKNESKI